MHFSRWSQWGGCRNQCGSSGVTIECPCELCDPGTARNQYDVQWSIPGGAPYGSGFSGSERLSYVSGAAGCCTYEGTDTHDVCGVDCYAQLVLCGSTATIYLRSLADDSAQAWFILDTVLGDADCSGDYSLRPGIENVFAGCGNVPLATASASGVGTEEPPCEEVPWVIAADPYPCCSCAPCPVWEEDPVELPGTPLPGHWIEVRGDWDYGGGWVSEDADALLLLNQPAAAGYDWRCVVVPTAIVYAPGEFNLVFGYEDEDNYYSARWTFNGSFDVMDAADSLKIYRTVAGVESEVAAEVEKKTQYVGHGPGTGLQFGVCVDADRTYVTAWVRDASDTFACLITSAELPAPGGDYVGFGPISGGNGGYRRNALGVVSADCLNCRRLATCDDTDLGYEPCIGGLMSRTYLLTPGGGWTNGTSGPGGGGNCACPQWSSLAVIVERNGLPNYHDIVPATAMCPWRYSECLSPPDDITDRFGCTTWAVYCYEAALWLEPSTIVTGQVRWRGYIAIYKSCGLCTPAIDSLAEYASDPFDPETWDCMAPFTLDKIQELFATEHDLTPTSCDPPAQPGFCSSWSLCYGSMASTLLVEPV